MKTKKFKCSQLLEGDRIESRLLFKIFSTLLQPNLVFMVDFNCLAGNTKNFFWTFDTSFHIYLLNVRISKIWTKSISHNGFLKADRAKNYCRITDWPNWPFYLASSPKSYNNRTLNSFKIYPSSRYENQVQYKYYINY